jgi:cytochrome c oxidase subunit 4
MAITKLYTIIYVVLFVLASAQVLVEEMFVESAYWTALWLIMLVSFVKALFVAGYYMHMREEPRSITYLMVGGLIVVLALTVAASYSIS